MELLKNLEGLSADEQMTAVVELQKAAMKHLEEQKQASIGKSAELVIQGLKKIKSDFEAKFDSLNYDIQTKVASLKDGEQGLQGPKGDQGERGLDGSNGRDGRDGKDGKDGVDGVDGVGVRDAKIDFDGSLVISLTDGREINCGEVVSVDVAKQIQKVTHNIQTGSGGDSQTVLDAIAAIQATIATYGTMATQNANNVAITGGAINNTTIGATTPSTGVFTTLTATGQTSLGGAADAEALRAVTTASAINWVQVSGATNGNAPSVLATGANTSVFLDLASKGTAGGIRFKTAVSTEQMRVSHTASAVNYVQVTGASTGNSPIISLQGSDANLGGAIQTKGTGAFRFYSGGGTAYTQLRIDGSNNAINFFGIAGSVTGQTPILSAASQSSDANVSMAFQSKGTGAIDLAAGSSGVNISNGGTVTAITRTAGGSLYTSVPSVAITAPTTAGGVQATATSSMGLNTISIASGGSGYSVNDVIQIVGGAGVLAQLTVTAVSGGAITTANITANGVYTTIPTSPASTTNVIGTGTGASINLLTYFVSSVVVSNAGSGYVEQPTVTFSGGGGSGAAAYATVGSGTVLRTLGSQIDFTTPGGVGFRVVDNGLVSNFPRAYGRAAGSSLANLDVVGSDTDITFQLNSKGTGAVALYTNSGNQQQLRVAHTASAVNYVQVTGAATTAAPVISVQGSDTNVAFGITSKGTSAINLLTNGGNQRQVQINHTASAVNYLTLTGSAASSAPVLAVAGTDTDIDLTLTPKGAGNVRFGTYTATVTAVSGYILIKDSGGTTRKLAVLT